jgi:PhnB protein
MTISAKHIPAGLQEVTPVLVVGDSNRAIEFHKTVFGAKERMRLTEPGGNIVHAELNIGHSAIMIGDEFLNGAISAQRRRFARRCESRSMWKM